MRTKGTGGFTIIELITVIAMIMLLMGAITASVTRARQRAKIQQAITEAQQLTDAILAYGNFVDKKGNSGLDDHATGRSWKLAAEGDLRFVLGQVGNTEIPVLYNGAVTGGSIRDPWGNPYWYRVLATAVEADDDHDGDQGEAAFAFPNINRIPADVR